VFHDDLRASKEGSGPCRPRRTRVKLAFAAAALASLAVGAVATPIVAVAPVAAAEPSSAVAPVK
jgi:hypothetical protein